MKRKVAFIIESFSVGGAERALVDIVNHLDLNKFNITIFSFYKHSVNLAYPFEIPRSELREGVRFKYLVDNHNKLIYRIFNYLLNHYPTLVFRWFIGDKYDDVVGFYEGAPTRFVSKVRLRRGRKITWLQTSVELSQKGKNEDAIIAEGIIYSAFDLIVSLSQGVKESFVSMFPNLRDKVTVAYHPMDMAKVVRLGDEPPIVQRPEIPLLVSVGRITWVKGHDRYLRVIDNLLKKGYRFEVWIIGGGDRTLLEEYCSKHNLDNVKFMGNQTNPFPFMKLADWFVMPSYVEGFGSVQMEALALGKAVISTKCSGTTELLGNSEYGLVVDNSEDSLQEGLEKVLSEEDLKYKYESVAKERAKLFDIDACIRRIEEVLYV